MYSTVVSSHATTIRHATPQPTGIQVTGHNAAAFGVDSEQTLAMHQQQAIPHGAYSIPVQISASADYNKDGYETPSFIHKKEKQINDSVENQGAVASFDPLNGSSSNPLNIDPAEFLKSSMEEDIHEFTAQFDKDGKSSNTISACKYLENKLK